ncbi:hypothetical protein NDU88_005127 [Pleurodeles waltl]|uniref:Uncharacterized protein n=1 Tax=Pleurodeles waltl TaxID=8319 RepID=A0AAV7SKT2_PLEWA|nr:hypothetical protein NDU88_005127 [Pleurodeles waltl]
MIAGQRWQLEVDASPCLPHLQGDTCAVDWLQVDGGTVFGIEPAAIIAFIVVVALPRSGLCHMLRISLAAMLAGRLASQGSTS